jgi:uncharacterized lipoprotein YajG
LVAFLVSSIFLIAGCKTNPTLRTTFRQLTFEPQVSQQLTVASVTLLQIDQANSRAEFRVARNGSDETHSGSISSKTFLNFAPSELGIQSFYVAAISAESVNVEIVACDVDGSPPHIRR